MIETFPKEVAKQLGYYVYKLIDPRDGAVFYVGKGKGDRVFAHCKNAIEQSAIEAEEDEEDEVSLKLGTIREILREDLFPLHIIARHGMTEDEAFLVEAALIDNTPGLTNIAGGHGSSERGPASAQQLNQRYCAEQIVLEPGMKVMAINVRKSEDERDYYDAVRFAWRVSKTRAERAELVFAVSDGICRGVFIPEEWLEATPKNFPNLTEKRLKGRHGFVGKEAPDEIVKKYRMKRMPDEFKRRKGMASPILYSYE
ncbi:MAG: hypothetical protein HOK33_01550 [Rhodobiaceae bacterium]|jgi:hypothetical protein|nr:hypothetical protein [Rhodobiaceae bacterium]MBT7279520.1 hypothetical protein [Rhodobiaceae bacterium]MDG2495419.1 hypothetical protein [Alphaproteobacteria bacterium]